MLLSKTSWFPALLLAGLGALNTLAFAPFTYHMLPLLTLSVLAWFLLQAQTPKQAALFGYAYGLGWFGVGISWVHVSIATFGGMPLIASLAIMALLVGYLALFPALAIWFSWRFRGNFWFPLVLASSWFITENIRSWFLTGFPWLSVGYSQTDGWMAPWAPVLGETGISFLILFIAGSVAVAVLSKLWVWPAIAAIVLIVSPALDTIKGWQETGEQVKVALVQGNIAQDLRWDPDQEAITMRKYMELSRPHLNADIMIWPEAAIPQLEPLALAYLFNLDMLAAENNTAVVTGILDYKENGDAYNGMIVLGKSGKEATGGDYRYNTKNRYQKHHLLPVGEFVPFQDVLKYVAPLFNLPMSSFSRGAWLQPNLQANGYSLLAALCFEIAFPRQMIANFDDNTDFLLTVSNDAWFGDSIGPHQHLEIARMRALELGRPLLRATNNGITATVTADGKEQARLPQFEEGVLTAEVPLVQGRTLYSLWGDWPLLAISLLCVGLLSFRRYQLTKQAK
ncbi:apolipoprotein N-acyltransferase [uncultured Rheinheimera sp.]|uniref:apolipoprotein N-acyltransferase n=1 Tax=uncultured Rheinheimera sp. TaxID=400532 RepID=UPI00259183CE|nr:apolipoprotein N-acyltransferase [uncultured Rheinheimera sp.]